MRHAFAGIGDGDELLHPDGIGEKGRLLLSPVDSINRLFYGTGGVFHIGDISTLGQLFAINAQRSFQNEFVQDRNIQLRSISIS